MFELQTLRKKRNSCIFLNLVKLFSLSHFLLSFQNNMDDGRWSFYLQFLWKTFRRFKRALFWNCNAAKRFKVFLLSAPSPPPLFLLHRGHGEVHRLFLWPVPTAPRWRQNARVLGEPRKRWQVPSASINCDLERKRGRENEEGQERERRKEKGGNSEMTPSAAIFSCGLWALNRSPFETRATLRRRFCIRKYHRCLAVRTR